MIRVLLSLVVLQSAMSFGAITKVQHAVNLQTQANTMRVNKATFCGAYSDGADQTTCSDPLIYEAQIKALIRQSTEKLREYYEEQAQGSGSGS